MVIGVEQALEDLGADLREEQVVERVGGAERVPETGVGVEDALVDLAIVGAEIDRAVVLVELVEPVGIDDAAVEGAVERAPLPGGAWSLRCLTSTGSAQG